MFGRGKKLMPSRLLQGLVRVWRVHPGEASVWPGLVLVGEQNHLKATDAG